LELPIKANPILGSSEGAVQSIRSIGKRVSHVQGLLAD
jgi:hypothetical protein